MSSLMEVGKKEGRKGELVRMIEEGDEGRGKRLVGRRERGEKCKRLSRNRGRGRWEGEGGKQEKGKQRKWRNQKRNSKKIKMEKEVRKYRSEPIGPMSVGLMTTGLIPSGLIDQLKLVL